MDDLQTQIIVEAAKKKLAVYQGLVLRTDENLPAIPPRHLAEIVIPAIQDDSLGNTVIIAPPGSAKTLSVIAACSWWLGQNPNQHIGFFSNTHTQATKRSVAVRDTVAYSDRYKSIFPGIFPDMGKGWSEVEWYLKRDDVADKDPSMLATGVGGPILGSRLNRVILDDIADSRNMATADQREKVIDWLKRTLMTRMTPTGRIVMIATRWHEQDPTGWAKEEGWHVVHIDAEQADGESYWPEYWPMYKLDCKNHGSIDGLNCWEQELPTGNKIKGQCKRKSLGTKDYNQQYRGRVTDDSSSLLKRRWWQAYDKLPADATRGAIFVDMAHVESSSADYSVVAVMRTNGVNFYITDLFRAKMEFPELKKLVKMTQEAYNLPVFIEQTPGSLPLIQSLKREASRINGWKIEGRSKMARVNFAVPFAESGNIFYPRTADWADDFIEECAMFPFGAHDDQVDAFTMGMLYLGPKKVKWHIK